MKQSEIGPMVPGTYGSLEEIKSKSETCHIKLRIENHTRQLKRNQVLMSPLRAVIDKNAIWSMTQMQRDQGAHGSF